MDHVLPRSQGGQTTWENAVCSCLKCNTKKGSRTPSEARMKLLTQPKAPKTNPQIRVKLQDPRYESWKTFLPASELALDVG